MIDSILILAAGKGERLGELTKNTPKPLLRIDKSNTTILDRLIYQCMREFPCIPVHINISYLADSFLRHFSSRSLDVTPKFLFEKRVLGPAKTLQEFQKLGFHKTLVIHGDADATVVVCTEQMDATLIRQQLQTLVAELIIV